MSVSFTWADVSGKKPSFQHGSSSDCAILDAVFPSRKVTEDDLPTLRAMHLASGEKGSLWGDIAAVIEAVRDARADVSGLVVLQISSEF